jgi:CRISPR-associated protein Cmr6
LNGNSDSTEKVAASIKSVRESDRLLQKEFSCKLKLVTPAFFAGADQTDKEGCDLRPATLRGQLRWWWRTMHAAHVSSKTLLDLENVIWGDTKNSGCVQVSLTREGEIVFEGLDRRISDNHRVIENPEFFRHYRIDRPQGQGTPGLFYASYGMEISRNGRTQRYIAKGGSWQVHFKIRPNVQSNPRMESSDIVNQVKYSLWLLTQFGGVGAKSRRGFGSLALEVNAGFNGLTLDKIREESRIFREKCSLVRHDAGTGTAALESARFIEGLLPENVPSENAWQVMNYIGTILRDFSQSATNSRHGKHCKEKVALGLPRKIHGPEKNRMNHQTVHTRPVELKGQKGNRHASPLIFHVASSGNNPGKFVIRSTIFPNNYLWSTVAGEGTNIEDSKSYWNKLEAYLKGKLITPPAGEIPTAINPQPGDRVRVKLKSYIPRTGQWQIISLDEGNKPGLLDSLNAPQDLHLKPGMEVEVLVSNRRSFYQWP